MAKLNKKLKALLLAQVLSSQSLLAAGWLKQGDTFDLVKWMDVNIIHPVSGSFYLGCTQLEHDQRVIEKIDAFLYRKMEMVPQYLDLAFGQNAQVVEREAAHSRAIRIFIHESKIPEEAVAIARFFTKEEQKVGLAYLSAIDRGFRITAKLNPYYFNRIKVFAEDFIAKADQAEKDFYKMESMPSSFEEKSRVRPRNPLERIPLGPKFCRHPVTSLTLGEFRRILEPPQQESVDTHFHKMNMKSRPKLIQEMKESGKKVTEFLRGKKISYEKGVQIEFYTDRNQTTKRNFSNSIQNGGSFLTTEGKVTEFQFDNDKTLFLIEYLNYKLSDNPTRYLVSNIIPIGDDWEEYTAEIESYEEAVSLLTEKSF